MKAPKLDEYQSRFVANVDRVIANNWLRRRPAIRMLDMGCDTSGRQLRHLAALTRGEVVGINVPTDFPTAAATEAAGPRVTLKKMDGMKLTFPDASFDLVVSANVIEHVPDPGPFIREAARVLKPNGICYMETAPIWTSARGHHVMESMIAENCPDETNFRDDGSIIPEWSHLSLSRQQMADHLAGKVLPGTREYILRFLYDSDDLNKVPWQVINAHFHSAFPFIKVISRPVPGIDNRLMPTDGADDYTVYGFTAVGRKRPQNWLAKRLYWRLRRLGL